MLVIALHVGDQVDMANGAIKLRVLSVHGRIVRLGFDAPKEISIVRQDVVPKDQEGDKNGNTR